MSIARPLAQLPPPSMTPARRGVTVRPFALNRETEDGEVVGRDPDPNIRTQLEREHAPGGYDEC
jgi:hypothetical protein